MSGMHQAEAFPVDRGLQVIPSDDWLDRMCNLYSLHTSRQAMGRLFRVSDNRMGEIPDQLTLFPGHNAPLVRLAADGEREVVTMSWGFVLLQDGKAPRRVTNTRDVKAASPFWKASIEQRRCLVPVTSFAEPDDGKPVNWHWFALTGDEPRPLFAFAGIWRRWKGPIKKDGPTEELDVYSFMTTLPNALTKAINHERLPVLLTSQEDFDTWLHGDAAARHRLLQPFPADRMREVQAGLDKKDLMAYDCQR
jgi:putative SOS response-associated peptidase YedK